MNTPVCYPSHSKCSSSPNCHIRVVYALDAFHLSALLSMSPFPHLLLPYCTLFSFSNLPIASASELLDHAAPCAYNFIPSVTLKTLMFPFLSSHILKYSGDFLIYLKFHALPYHQKKSYCIYLLNIILNVYQYLA